MFDPVVELRHQADQESPSLSRGVVEDIVYEVRGICADEEVPVPESIKPLMVAGFFGETLTMGVTREDALAIASDLEALRAL